ncbi:MAG: TonB-dependent receptor [Bacteroidales bacterium]|nr:TonB-dependent receptor [Bacteroidales bacterium]
MLASIVLSLLSSNLFAQSQKQYSVSGTIADASSGEDLIGAMVRVKERPTLGAISNVYGFYSLSLPQGNYTLEYSYVGFQLKSIKVSIKTNLTKNVELSSSSRQIKGVEITGERSDANVTSSEMSVSKVSIKEVEKIPVLFGERDVMKTIQLLPGIKSEGDGGAGFFVRGGSADQNLILLDEAPVYNASHMMGFFSVFNSDALKDVKLYKGGTPAQYGGRLSSVMDIKMKEGNNKTFHASGGIGLISSKLSIEGPIVKDKGSFIVSGRRTYADIFLVFSTSEEQKKSTLFFYDFNVKANYKISDKDRIFLSGYLGRDKFGFNEDFGFDWGNKTATFRWNHIFNSKLFSNTTVLYSDYNYVFKASFNNKKIEAGSEIVDFNIKEDLQYFINNNNKLRFGGNLIHHTFSPGDLKVDDVIQPDNTLEDRYSLESALYISNEQKIGKYFQITYGLRYSNFTQIGPGTIYNFDTNGELLDTANYTKNEKVASFNGLAPRVNMLYIINPKSSVKASYARTYQYLHLVSNSTSSTPTDVWLPSSNNVKPEIADQVALGYFRNFKNNIYEFSAEIYYKKIQNAIDYRVGAEVNFNPYLEGDLIFGDGRAYGLELMFKKRIGRFTGWTSYTLSRVEKQFEEINSNTFYPARQDRTHDFSIVGMFDITERLNIAATWVFYTGSAVTFPSAKYIIDGMTYNYYTERNGYRMPDYHRLDFGINWNAKEYTHKLNIQTGKLEKVRKRIQSSWNFSVYNVYGRENAYSISFRTSANNPNNTEAVQLSLFRWIPSVSYNFKF